MISLPTDIDFVAAVKADYVNDRINLDQFEADLEVVLAGGLPDRFFPTGLPPRDPTKLTTR